MTELDYHRTALLVITPDAVRRHLGQEIVQRVLRAGFVITAHRLWANAPGGLDSFHRRNAPVARDPALYRLVEELFALGPLLALAVQSGPTAPAEDVHRRLAALKGRGDPAYAVPGSIRNDLGSINTVLNVVHSSDDPQDTAREAALFLEAGPGPLESGLPALHRSLRLAQLGHPRETRVFEDVLGGVRARVLAALWERLAPAQREHVDAWCSQAGVRGLGRPQGGELLAGVLPAGHRLRGFVTPPAPGTQPTGPVPEIEVDALADLGIALDPWEHLVLATSRHYPPLPAPGGPPPGPPWHPRYRPGDQRARATVPSFPSTSRS